MNIRDLEYLVAVAELGHFGKAATACFVSQPTLSAQLKKLEEFLGCQLIERGQKKALMTQVGQEVVQHARQLLDQRVMIQSIARDYQDPLAGQLKLGLIPTIAPFLLPVITKPIKKQLTNLTLALYESKTQDLLVELRAGKLDLIVLALPLEDQLDGLTALKSYSEEFYLAVHCEHSLADKKEVKWRDLNEQTLALLGEGHCMRDHAWDACSLAKNLKKSDYAATSLETLRYMIEAGEATTLMPALAKNPGGRKGSQINYIPFAGNPPARDICLVFRKSCHRVDLFERINEIVKASVLGLPLIGP
ncbi:MAG: DNA-binding transcriptional regulator OxyR [Gammaproteobacteria bacterium]|nr:MAG: DNA-binding transcriptional regulator OxyR [Gammaproteobacteria bacterium]